jgi:hypothetical protein
VPVQGPARGGLAAAHHRGNDWNTAKPGANATTADRARPRRHQQRQLRPFESPAQRRVAPRRGGNSSTEARRRSGCARAPSAVVRLKYPRQRRTREASAAALTCCQFSPEPPSSTTRRLDFRVCIEHTRARAVRRAIFVPFAISLAMLAVVSRSSRCRAPGQS